MSGTGKWNIIVKTPMGDTSSTLDLTVEGENLTGTLHDKDGTQTLANGKALGGTLTWEARLKKPFPIKLQFTATVDGDSISGGAKSPFGVAPFSGVRAG